MLFPFERELEAVSGFTNPFSDSFEDNELYFLTFAVPPNMFLNGILWKQGMHQRTETRVCIFSWPD